MNFACSTHLCVNEWQRHARDAVISASAVSLNEDVNT